MRLTATGWFYHDLAMRTGAIVVALAVLAGGCGSKDTESGKASEAETQGAGKQGGDTPDAKKARQPKPPKGPADIAEAEARKVLEAWLAAQNGGDFGAYDTLYAAQFFGVKRVGESKTTYDRAGWLKDRGRMFKRKMVVEATGVTISSNPRSAVIHFTQTWSSGKFRDEGPKQLIVVEEKGALRISREEMLQSQQAPALSAWAKSIARNKPVKAEALPKDVVAELVRLSDGVSGGDPLGDLSWALALTETLVVYEIDSEPEFGDDGPPGWHRGATAHLILARSDKGKFVVSGLAEEQGVSHALTATEDLDGDGIGDPEFGWSWYHDHEGAEGVAIVLSKSNTVLSTQISTNMGEQGYASARKILKACFTKVDGKLAYVSSYIDESIEPEDEENWPDSKSIERKAPGFELSVVATTGFAPARAFAYWSDRGPRFDKYEDAPCDDPDETFAIHSQATSDDGGAMLAVSGLSLDEATAKKKAAAAGFPDNVIELGAPSPRKHNRD